jgi:hypothetical protein
LTTVDLRKSRWREREVAEVDVLVNALDDCRRVPTGVADILEARKHDAHIFEIDAIMSSE